MFLTKYQVVLVYFWIQRQDVSSQKYIKHLRCFCSEISSDLLVTAISYSGLKRKYCPPGQFGSSSVKSATIALPTLEHLLCSKLTLTQQKDNVVHKQLYIIRLRTRFNTAVSDQSSHSLCSNYSHVSRAHAKCHCSHVHTIDLEVTLCAFHMCHLGICPQHASK